MAVVEPLACPARPILTLPLEIVLHSRTIYFGMNREPTRRPPKHKPRHKQAHAQAHARPTPGPGTSPGAMAHGSWPHGSFYLLAATKYCIIGMWDWRKRALHDESCGSGYELQFDSTPPTPTPTRHRSKKRALAFLWVAMRGFASTAGFTPHPPSHDTADGSNGGSTNSTTSSPAGRRMPPSGSVPMSTPYRSAAAISLS